MTQATLKTILKKFPRSPNSSWTQCDLLHTSLPSLAYAIFLATHFHYLGFCSMSSAILWFIFSKKLSVSTVYLQMLIILCFFQKVFIPLIPWKFFFWFESPLAHHTHCSFWPPPIHLNPPEIFKNLLMGCLGMDSCGTNYSAINILLANILGFDQDTGHVEFKTVM